MLLHELVTHARRMAKSQGKAHVMRRPRRPLQPLAIEASYAQSILARLKPLKEILDRVLEPRLEAIVKSAGIRLDDWTDDLDRIFDLMGSTYASMEDPEDLAEMIENYGRQISNFQKTDLTKNLAQSAGVNVFFNDKDLLTRMKAYVKQNVDLISSIDEDLLADVKSRIMVSVRAGDRVEDIRDMIEDRYDVSKSRAMLIARDQTGKFYGELNRERQTSIGINKYIWRGVGDDREREMHLDLEGEEFEWGKPPVTNPQGDLNEPGGDYQCRCTAEPVLESFVPDYEEEAYEGTA